MSDIKDFDCAFENKWCPGCGNFSILTAMKQALAGLGLTPEKTLIVSGIGQAAKTPHFMKCNMFHSLHGRALPVATGVKMANHNLTVLVNSGDGDCYGEGGNHFISAVRRNIDLTLLVHNNQVYGLTKGQASPTSQTGMVTKMQPHGVISEPFNALAAALCMGGGFVARGFSGNVSQLTHLIQQGIRYKGLALIDILQPCVSFNKINTYSWYKKRVYDLFEEDHTPDDFEKALKLSMEWGDRIPTGILYKKEKPSFTDQVHNLKSGTLVSKRYDPKQMEKAIQTMRG